MDNKKFNEIDYNNVVFKQYTFPYRQFKSIMADFSKEILEDKLTPNGMLFYSVDGFNRKSETDADVIMTIYQPVKETSVSEDATYSFADRFTYGNMSYKIVREDFDVNIELAYSDLYKQAELEGKRITSPFFNEFILDKDENGKNIVICVVKAHME